MDACRAGSDELLASLMARYQKQVLLDWDQSLTVNAARIITATLYGPGFEPKGDQTYRDAADQARRWGRAGGQQRAPPAHRRDAAAGRAGPRVLLSQDLEGSARGGRA